MSHEKQIFISLDSEFRQAMSDCGIRCNQPLVIGGEIQRFSSNGKTDKNSWYFLYPQGIGYFGDWSRNITKKWQVQGLKLDEQQQKQVKTKLSEVNKNRKLAQGIIAKDSLALWQNLSDTGKSLYLKRKQVSAFGIRFGKDNESNIIYVPLRDADNKLWSLQKIFDNGSKLFLPNGKKNGYYHIIGSIDEAKPLYVTEGYATGASVHMATGACTIIAFDAGNIEHVLYSIRLKYPKTPIIIAADNDQYSDLNTGRIKAESAASKYNCSIILPEFTNTDLKPTDFNDLHVLEGLEKVKEQLEKIKNIDQQPALASQQFKVSKKSVFYISHDKNGNSKELWLSSLIKLEAYFCDKDDNNHGILLSWHSAKTNKLHSWAMPAALLAGDGNEIFRKLLSEGVEINSSKKAKDKLLEYLATIRTDKKLTCLNKIGWDDGIFVLPDATYPNHSNLVFQSELSHFSGFGTSGTLADWQSNIARFAGGNSRLMLALSIAFAAPLLKLVNEESGAIHLVGNSSMGKTTALYMAASVWGGGKDTGFIKQWRTTCNALEVVAETHRDCLLPLDELSQADSKSVGDMVYMLANNQGKARLKSSITLRSLNQWRVLILSSGEVTLQTKIEESGKKIFVGMEVRFVSLQADTENSYGIFENLHEFASGETLSKYLKEASTKYYGTAIRVFLEQIVKNTTELIPLIKQIQHQFCETNVPLHASGQVSRVASRFGLLAAAGELATEFGILPFAKGDVIQSISKCFNSWLFERGSAKDFEQEIVLEQIKGYFEKYGESKFITIGDYATESEKVKSIDRIGFKQKIDGNYHYFVLPECYKTELCKGLNYKQVTKYLVEHGFLQPDNHGKNLVVKSLPNIGKVRIYHFKPKILS